MFYVDICLLITAAAGRYVCFFQHVGACKKTMLCWRCLMIMIVCVCVVYVLLVGDDVFFCTKKRVPLCPEI